ncbi:MAG TPA: hypothetical protein PKB02_06860 [Anaerohalosphaeraceae bacterium]|nr:hypothetical protein [Anaerohalosphaeraceae bacterium]
MIISGIRREYFDNDDDHTWDGRIDGLSRGGAALAGYDYLGQRVAWRAYNTTTPVVAAYSYDMLGRVTDIDADSSRVDLHYSYVPQEHNIAGIRFDHRAGTPYIPNGHDYSASKRSKWLKLPYLAATNRKISSRISIIATVTMIWTGLRR